MCVCAYITVVHSQAQQQIAARSSAACDRAFRPAALNKLKPTAAATAAAAAAVAAADAAAAAENAAAAATPTTASRLANRARSTRKRGRAVDPSAGAAAARRRSRERRKNAAEACDIMAQLSAANARAMEFAARNLKQRPKLAAASRAAAAAAAAIAADADGDDDGDEDGGDGGAAGSSGTGDCENDAADDVEEDVQSSGAEGKAHTRVAGGKPSAPYPKRQRLQRMRQRVGVMGEREMGHPVGDVERRMLLLAVMERVDEGDGRERAIRKISHVFGAGRATLRNLIEKYDCEALGAALPPGTAAPPLPPAEFRQGRPRKFVTLDQGDKARALVKEAADAGKTVTYMELYKGVSAHTTQPMVGINSFRKQLRERFNLRFLRCGKVVPRSVFGAEHMALRDRFVVGLSDALEQQRLGTAVVVWYDESFCHQHIRRFGTVADMTDPTQWVARRRAAPAATIKATSKGKLFVICHAATENGLLVGNGSDGKRAAPPATGPGASATYPTAEWVWQTNDENKDPDYHNHVTADTIVQYFERRLFPAVRQLFPGRRVIVVLDNSRNHTAMPDDYVSPDTGTKEQMVQVLMAKSGYKSFHVVRHGVDLRFRPTQWDKKPSKKNPRRGGPSKDEVAAVLKGLYSERPDLSRTKLQRLFAAQVRISTHCIWPCTY